MIEESDVEFALAALIHVVATPTERSVRVGWPTRPRITVAIAVSDH